MADKTDMTKLLKTIWESNGLIYIPTGLDWIGEDKVYQFLVIRKDCAGRTITRLVNIPVSCDTRKKVEAHVSGRLGRIGKIIASTRPVI